MTLDDGDRDRIPPPNFGDGAGPPSAPRRRFNPDEKRQLIAKAEELNALGEHLEDIIARIETMKSLFAREAQRIVEEDVFLKLRDDPNGALLDAAATGRPVDIALLLRRQTVDLKETGKRALALAEENGHEECARLLRDALGQTGPWWKRLFGAGGKRDSPSSASAAKKPLPEKKEVRDHDANDQRAPDDNAADASDSSAPAR